MAQVVPLRYDTAFKKAFSQLDVFSQFAEDVLGIEFHADKVQQGYKFLKPVGQVEIKYDLFAEDPESRIVVEVQHVKERHFYDRSLYDQLINLVKQAENNKTYGFEGAAYTIVVLTSPYLEHEIDFSIPIAELKNVNEFRHKIEGQSHHIVFVAPRLVNEKTPPRIKQWCNLFLDSLDGEIDESQYV